MMNLDDKSKHMKSNSVLIQLKDHAAGCPSALLKQYQEAIELLESHDRQHAIKAFREIAFDYDDPQYAMPTWNDRLVDLLLEI